MVKQRGCKIQDIQRQTVTQEDNHSVARKGGLLNKLSLKGLCFHFTSPPPTYLSVTQPNPNPYSKRLSQKPVLGCFWE